MNGTEHSDSFGRSKHLSLVEEANVPSTRDVLMRAALALALQRSRLLLASTGVALALSLPAAATASHSTYWFFQGNLPTGGGTATVHHEAICCYTFMVVRMSWEPATHDMNFLFIHRDGSWHGLLAEYWDADQEAIVPTDTYARGGCQNPPS